MSLKIYPPGGNPNLPRYSFYGGTETLVFDKEVWTYYRVMPDGSLAPQDGVTTVLHKTIDRSEPIANWSIKRAMVRLKKLMLERNLIAIEDREPLPLFETILDEVIESAKHAAREELEQAADIGTDAHAHLELIVKAILADNRPRLEELLAKYPESEPAENCVIAALSWSCAHSVKWLASERKCFSRIHGVAGTMDGLAKVSSCGLPECCPNPFVNRLSLIDFKSSKGLWPSYCMQAAIYAAMYAEETGEKVEDRWILRLDKETAEFEPWHLEGDEKFQQDLTGYLNALAHYRSLRTIENRIDDTAKQKRAVAKAILAAERAVRCLDADRYKGVRKKRGCNGTDIMCETCTSKYRERNGAAENAVAATEGKLRSILSEERLTNR